MSLQEIEEHSFACYHSVIKLIDLMSAAFHEKVRWLNQNQHVKSFIPRHLKL